MSLVSKVVSFYFPQVPAKALHSDRPVFPAGFSSSTWWQPAPALVRFPSWRTSSLPGLLCPSGMPSKGLCKPGSWTGQCLCSLEIWGAVGLTPLLTSPRTENYHCMTALPRMASDHHITPQSFSVHKPQVWQVPSLVFYFIIHVRGYKHSRNLLDCFCPDVLYFQLKILC